MNHLADCGCSSSNNNESKIVMQNLRNLSQKINFSFDDDIKKKKSRTSLKQALCLYSSC